MVLSDTGHAQEIIFFAKRFGVRFDFADTAPIHRVLNSATESLMDDGVDVGDGVTIDKGRLKAHHIAALMDFYPFVGTFRVSGGYMWGHTRVNANINGIVADLSANEFYFELAGNHYYYTGNAVHGTASLDRRYHGPYIGGGWDLRLIAGLKLYLDAGVVFTNRSAHTLLDVPLRNLWYYNSAVNRWEHVNTPQLQAQVDAVKALAIRDADDELGKYRLYPILKLGLMYRF